MVNEKRKALCVKKWTPSVLFFYTCFYYLLWKEEIKNYSKLFLVYAESLFNLHTEKYKYEHSEKCNCQQGFFEFLNKGYKACTLKNLEQITGLTKGAFYYYFKNKEEILKEGLERYAMVIEDIDEAAFYQIRSLKEYIEVVLQEKERRAQQLRELFGTFIIEEFYFQLVLEIEFLFPVYRQRIDALLKNRLARWEEMIIKAKQQEEILNSLDTSVLARNLMSVPMSMVNIELMSADLSYAFSDMRMQFEQYYMLIKK